VIPGRYLDGRDSRQVTARLEIGADRIVRIHVDDVPAPPSVPLESVSVSDRVGRIPRRFTFPDGSAFETDDNDAVDEAMARAGHARFDQRIARWESRWPVALGAMAAVAAISWLFIRHGVPWTASVAARVLPPSVDRAIGIQGLDLLDKTLLAPSRLPDARREELSERFKAMTRLLADGHAYRLEMRRGKSVGANALALPSGIVVVTDELVKLAGSDDEIIAVLAHEIGHVRGRHALRMLLQNAGIATLALTVLGDVSSVSALAAAIPGALIQAKHSRDFEREADAFSRDWLERNGIEPARFDSILCRLAVASKESVPPAGGDRERSALSYWSSHPPTAERAACKPRA
jgi:Zn-dependent protease with chaperone function